MLSGYHPARTARASRLAMSAAESNRVGQEESCWRPPLSPKVMLGVGPSTSPTPQTRCELYDLPLDFAVQNNNCQGHLVARDDLM